MPNPDDDFVVLDRHGGGGDDNAVEQNDAVQDEIRKWLDPTEYDDGASEYIKHLRSHLGGTGDWIEETPEYQQWHSDSDSNVLWVKAVAGTGKSVLAARTRSRLSRKEGVPILYFFFRHIVTTNRSPKQLVRDWLAQLLPYSLYLQDSLKDDILDKNLTLEGVAFDTLWAMIREAIGRLPLVYCFADALDEMSLGNDMFMMQLAELGNVKSCKIFLTSRPVPHIITAFRQAPMKLIQITLGPANMSEDISKYVDHRLERDISRYIDHRLLSSGLILPEAEAGNLNPTALVVRETLKSRAQGSFLYARLMTDSLLAKMQQRGNKVTREDLGHALESLPTGLNEMYKSMLLEHADRTGTPWDLQLAILQWVTHSERPLRLLELATVLEFQRRHESKRSAHTKAQLRTVCGPLLEILPSDVVGPIHHSFTEFLVQPKDETTLVDGPSAHRMMAEACIGYLTKYLNEHGLRFDDKSMGLDETKLRYPFLEYAMSQWHQHVRKYDRADPQLLQLLDQMLVGESQVREEWAVQHNGTRGVKMDKYRFPADTTHEASVTPMHIAANTGLHHYIDHLISLGHAIEPRNVSDEAPIHYASRSGWPCAVSSLLRAGAQADLEDKAGLKPLHKAATRNHHAVVKVLLESGVNPLTPKTRATPVRKKMPGKPTSGLGDTPVQYACESGHAEALAVFIPYLDTAELTEALGHTFGKGKFDLAMMLVQADKFDANLPILEATPLAIASYYRRIDVMEKLLAKGADVNKLSMGHFPSPRQNLRIPFGGALVGALPLHTFAQSRPDIYYARRGLLLEEEQRSVDGIARGLKILIQAGNSIEAKDGNGETALYKARDSFQVSSALLKLGAEVKSALRDYETPLHAVVEAAGCVSESDCIAAARLWLDHGIDVNAKEPKRARTALLNCRQNKIALMRFLVERGADVEAKDFYGITALHLAAISRESPEIVTELFDLLLDAGADANARTLDGETPLLYMANLSPFHMSKFRALLHSGADINARNRRGQTLLLKYCRFANTTLEKHLQDLLSMGCRVDIGDANGASCIHYFVQGGPEKVWDDIVAAGADPTSVDAAGNNAWHYAALHTQSESRGWVLNKLKDLGIDHLARNTSGCTPLLAALAVENELVIRFLKDRMPCPDINVCDVQYRSPLHIAAASGPTRVKQYLDIGAKLHARTVDGWSLLHFAAQARQSEVLKLVLTMPEHNAKDMINFQDAKGRTALHLAARSGLRESVEVLLDAGANAELSDAASTSPLEWCAHFPEERRKWVDNLSPSHTTHDEDIQAALMAKDNEDLARVISIRRSMSRDSADVFDKNSNIQLCVKTLKLAKRGKGQKPGVWKAAIDADCRPMIEELLVDTNTAELSEIEPAGLRTRVVLIASQVRHAQQNLSVQTANETLSTLGQLAPAELVSVYGQTFDPIVGFKIGRRACPTLHKSCAGRQHPFKLLVQVGAREALRRLASHPNSAMLLRGFDEFWDSSDRTLEAFDQELITVWDRLLVLACTRHLPNLPVVRAVLELFPVTKQGRDMALFILAATRRVWNIEALSYLLENGANPNARNVYGETPLHKACESEFPWGRTSSRSPFFESAVINLLRHGADPNLLDDEGASCFPADLKTLRHLLEFGANVHLGQPSLLSKAIQELEVDVVELLLGMNIDLNKRSYPEILDDKPSDSSTAARKPRSQAPDSALESTYPLHLAAQMTAWRKPQIPAWRNIPADFDTRERKHTMILRALLAAGADPYLITETGESILMNVVRTAKEETVMVLIEQSEPRPDHRDSNGQTILLALASRLCIFTLERPQLFDTFQLLLARGARIDDIDSTGQTVLHMITKYLSDKEHKPPSFLDSEEGRHFMALCQDRGLIDASDNDGNRPLHYCLKNRNWDAAKRLIAHGADPRSHDADGNNAFHYLAPEVMNKNQDQLSLWIEFFRDLKVDINARNKAGEPPIFSCVRACPVAFTTDMLPRQEGQEEVDIFVPRMQYMLAAGADVGAVSETGQCALHALASCRPRDRARLAREVPLRAIWEKLLAEGLVPYMEDNEQRSALDIAAVCGNTTILDLY